MCSKIWKSTKKILRILVKLHKFFDCEFPFDGDWTFEKERKHSNNLFTLPAAFIKY